MTCSVRTMGRFLSLKTFSNLKVRENISKHFSTSSDDLLVEKLNGKYSGVTVFGMNRPERKNALGVNLVNKLNMELDNISCDEKARVLVIKSLVKGIFCSG